jgi:hypothetical protein
MDAHLFGCLSHILSSAAPDRTSPLYERTGDIDAALLSAGPTHGVVVDPRTGRVLDVVRWDPRPDEPRAVVAFRAGGPSA